MMQNAMKYVSKGHQKVTFPAAKRYALPLPAGSRLQYPRGSQMRYPGSKQVYMLLGLSN